MDVPVPVVEGGGMWPFVLVVEVEREGRLGVVVFVGLAIVVLRWRCVVSVLGGGGRWESRGVWLRREARQRKHSPVP